jgi:hypothetical protein
MMTKRHFEAVAATLRENGHRSATNSERRVLAYVALDLARVFAGLNPRFDRGRFLAACGLGIESIDIIAAGGTTGDPDWVDEREVIE